MRRSSEPAVCAAPGCDNVVARANTPGRPAIYCSAGCRPSRHRAGVAVEVAHPDASPDGRDPSRVWVVRLRRGQRVVTVADGIGWPSASALATELEDLLLSRPRQEGGATD
jgi:hypothetical protein